MQELLGIHMPEKWFRLEKEFTSHWLSKLREKGYWAKKWSDASRDLKPFDCSIRTDVADYSCEIKVIDDDAFFLSLLRPNQIASLSNISALGGNAIVVIYSKKHNSYVVKDFKELK